MEGPVAKIRKIAGTSDRRRWALDLGYYIGPFFWIRGRPRREDI